MRGYVSLAMPIWKTHSKNPNTEIRTVLNSLSGLFLCSPAAQYGIFYPKIHGFPHWP
jgi:hypothetical protein